MSSGQQFLRGSAPRETYVVKEVKDGYEVYPAGDPKKVEFVSGSPEEPHCTCDEFERHGARCAHIGAAFEATPLLPKHEDDEERAAIQAENQAPEPRNGSMPTVMTLKRSVSPDGRIDSLSIEFACPVDGLTRAEIRSKYALMLDLQDETASAFLTRREAPEKASGPNGRNGTEQHSPSHDAHDGNGLVPAQLLGIEGMDGKWGRRLYLTVQANGRRIRLFGSQKKLAEAIRAAGHSEAARDISEGLTLRLPCRITTKHENGYLAVDRIFPPNGRMR